MPWSASAHFGRKTVLHSTATSSLGWAFLSLVNRKAFSRVFYTDHGISIVFFFFLPGPGSGSNLSSSTVTDGAASLAASRSITGFLSGACCHVFWQLDHRPFPGRIPDFYKNAFNGITLEPGKHLKSLQQDMNS